MFKPQFKNHVRYYTNNYLLTCTATQWWDICTKKDMPQNRTTTTQVYLESTDPANKITDTSKCPSVANINKAMAVLYEEKTNLLLCISKKTCEVSLHFTGGIYIQLDLKKTTQTLKELNNGSKKM